MLFNSFVFLYLFLPITYLFFWRIKEKKYRYIWLTLASYVFYGYWNYKFCFWMALSTLVSFIAGLGLRETNDPRRRKFFLVFPVVFDLVILAVFKYTNFILISLQDVLSFYGSPVEFSLHDIVLPVGISFYTFHTISYIVDAYRRTITPTRNFWEFACYVSLFSQLIAGPIVRFKQIEADLDNIDHARREQWLHIGWSFFVIGMIKKVLLADSLAVVIDPALKEYSQLSTFSAWLCMLGYTYQLYFDFSGYSDMAVGLGYLFGLRLPQNFHSPYKASGISDFWRRWHISLSSCLRDYLYIPLGGNRGGRLFVIRNVMITMLIGGLWHGANWTFVFWGAYHGFLLVLNREFQRYWTNTPDSLKRLVTFLLVVIGWVFFRSEDFSMATSILHKMFVWDSGPLFPGFVTMLVVGIVSAGLAHFGKNTFEMSHNWNGWQTVILTILFALCLFTMYGGQESPFLYFQF